VARMGPGRIREDFDHPALTAKRKSWRRGLLWLLIPCVLIAGLYLTRPYTLPRAAVFLDVSEAPCPVDCALVLGGDDDTRPFVAAALFKKHLANVILVPRVKPSPGIDVSVQPPEQEVIRRVLGIRGVPDDAIHFLPGEVTSTADEARALREYLGPDSRSSVAVVTNGFHTRRACAIFRKVFAGSRVQLHFVAAPTDGFNEQNWWHFERGWEIYLTEYVKLLLVSLGSMRHVAEGS
jgi:uncharacterized SAM-binding protein YcdF (DUF218 family)